MTTPIFDPDKLTCPEFHATGDPHAVWRWMREYQPVHWHEPGQLPGFWSVVRYLDIRAVYGDHATFSSAEGVLLRAASRGADPGGGRALALTDPPRHRAVRSLLAEAFSLRAARTLQDALRSDTRALLGAAIERGSCDFAQDIAAPLAIAIICRVLGVPPADFADVHRWTHEAFEAQQPLTGHLPMISYLVELMADRSEHPAADAASALTHGQVDGKPLSELEILLNLENLVGATENAGLSMASGLQAFLEHPAQWRRLRADRSLLPSATEEILRWTSSATHSMRTATGRIVLHDREIGPGDRVVVWLPSANRDEAVFADPQRFDIGRQPNRQLALGFGNHVCIGGNLARTQLKILLAELLDTVGEIEPAGQAVPLASIAVSGPAHLPLRLTRAEQP
jgi:cytochrome P450